MLKSFPIPIAGRGKLTKTIHWKYLLSENWFSIDPQSFNIEQLNAYKKAVRSCKKIFKENIALIPLY